MEEKIIELLGRGYSQTIVASAVGCDDSYISQLLSDDRVRDQVAGLRLQHVHAKVDIDDSIDGLEKIALNKLHALMPLITKPMDALRIFQITNSAKRKAEVSTAGTETRAQIVQLSLPNVAMVQFITSSDKQVVEVNGKSMAPLSSQVLNKKLEERRARTPLLSDSATAAGLLNNLEKFPTNSIANVL